MNNKPASRMRMHSGSRMSPCCWITGFICQMPTVQVEFLELVNEINKSDWKMTFKMYRSKSFLNDCRTTVMDSWNIRIRDKFLLLLHMVNLHLIYSPCEIMTINVKSLQTWFIPLTNSTNKIYTFDIQHLGLHQARQQRQGLVSDPDFFRISSTQLSVNVLGNVSYTSCMISQILIDLFR